MDQYRVNIICIQVSSHKIDKIQSALIDKLYISPFPSPLLCQSSLRDVFFRNLCNERILLSVPDHSNFRSFT